MEAGQGMVEYGLLLALLALVVLGILTLTHERIGDTFSTVLNYLS